MDREFHGMTTKSLRVFARQSQGAASYGFNVSLGNIPSHSEVYEIVDARHAAMFGDGRPHSDLCLDSPPLKAEKDFYRTQIGWGLGL
jgi:hypothetical protein